MNVVLGREGVSLLIKYFKLKRDQLDNIVDEISKALSDRGYQLMLANAPLSDIDGNIGGTVGTEKQGKLYRITYSGQDVAYIEFGTGYVGEHKPYPDTENLAKAGWEYDIHGHGSNGWFYYSKRDGSLKHSKGGMYPEMPVFKSYTQLRDEALEIIKEVFNAKYAD